MAVILHALTQWVGNSKLPPIAILAQILTGASVRLEIQQLAFVRPVSTPIPYAYWKIRVSPFLPFFSYEAIYVFHFLNTVVGHTYMKISYGQGDAGDDQPSSTRRSSLGH
jgi:hypothetical protein